MNGMRLVLVVTFLAFSSINGNCQFLTGAGAGNNVLKESQYTNVQGSPYLYADWKSGAILDTNGKLSENMMIRYDSYRDEVQFLKDGRTLVIDPSLVPEFYFVTTNEETKKIENILFRNGFNVEGYKKLNYFQVIYSTGIHYLRKFKTEYIEEAASSFGTNEQIKRFERTESEFLINKDGSVVKVGKNRKELVSSFGNYAGQMKTFIKENKLNVKSDVDLNKILRKFEALNATGG